MEENATVKNIEVKTCPLCGADKINFSIKQKYGRDLFILSCVTCHCSVFDTYFNDLFDKWNKRKRSSSAGFFEFSEQTLKTYRGFNA
jgi:hypothetical protein